MAAKVEKAHFSAKYIGAIGSGNIKLKLNKESSQNTATVLFRKNWSSIAESGSNGNSNFTLKVSQSGENWKDGLLINATSDAICRPLEINENINASSLPPIAMKMARISSKDGDETRHLLESTAPTFGNYFGRGVAGTSSSPSASFATQGLVKVSGFGYSNSRPATNSTAKIAIYTTENWSDSAPGSLILYGDTINGTAVRKHLAFI